MKMTIKMNKSNLRYKTKLWFHKILPIQLPKLTKKIIRITKTKNKKNKS